MWSPDGKGQTGCSLGRIERFVDKGQVESVEENGETYYKINRLCNTCRNKDWANTKTAKNRWEYEDIAKKEIEFSYTVLVTEGSDSCIEAVLHRFKNTLAGIIQQKIHPKKIILVVRNNKVNRHLLNQEVKDISFAYKCKIPYGITFVVNPSATAEESIDIAFAGVKTMFYTMLENGHRLPPDYSKNINSLMNEELEQFVMIEPFKPEEADSGLTILSSLHKALYGNREMNLTKKIKDIDSEYSAKTLFTWEQVCNYLQPAL